METFRKRSFFENNRVVYVPVRDITPNPDQPRKVFDRQALEELSDSIKRYGIIQPLSVRKRGKGYELVAGERRLRAAMMAGLSDIPCIVLTVDSQQSGMIALVENLQRRDLDFIEEAQGLARLMKLYGLSQEQAAARVGKSQSAVANKLRLLKHSQRILQAMRDNNLSERHARALLRIEDEADRWQALQYIIANDLTVAKTEQYIDSLLTVSEEKPAGQTRTLLLKDVRFFLNSIKNNLRTIQDAGIPADMQRSETDEAVVLTITIGK